jgi:hypothetical protein
MNIKRSNRLIPSNTINKHHLKPKPQKDAYQKERFFSWLATDIGLITKTKLPTQGTRWGGGFGVFSG